MRISSNEKQNKKMSKNCTVCDAKSKWFDPNQNALFYQGLRTLRNDLAQVSFEETDFFFV